MITQHIKAIFPLHKTKLEFATSMQTYMINLTNTLHAKPPITIGKGYTIHGDNDESDLKYFKICV